MSEGREEGLGGVIASKVGMLGVRSVDCVEGA